MKKGDGSDLKWGRVHFSRGYGSVLKGTRPHFKSEPSPFFTSLFTRKELNMRVIVAAAGTGGHINPGLAIANKIKEKEPNSEIIFIGTTRGLENSLVPREGYELKTIEAYGLSKQISIQNFKKICATLKATGKARKIIQEFKPDVIVGAGGYICGPVVWAAKKEKIPVILHESNAFPGKAVKVLAKKADKVLISFEEARSRISSAKNIVFTGTPVKIEKKDYTEKQRKTILFIQTILRMKQVILEFMLLFTILMI